MENIKGATPFSALLVTWAPPSEPGLVRSSLAPWIPGPDHVAWPMWPWLILHVPLYCYKPRSFGSWSHALVGELAQLTVRYPQQSVQMIYIGRVIW
jgi:hypothetical protein